MTTGTTPARATLLPSATAALLLFFLAATACTAQAPTVSVFFGENSVWQREQPVRLRGTAAPGAKVSFDSEALGHANAVADDGGHWTLSLAPLSAGGPYKYEIASGGETLRVGDVYVGDVFICSGQSNMEWPVDATDDRDRATAVTDPLLHHIVLPHNSIATPQAEPKGAPFWQSAYPGRTEGFTAIGYYFAEELRQRQPDLPIGLINTSWGGSTIEAWLADAETGPSSNEVAKRNRARWDELEATYPEAFSEDAPKLRAHGPDGEPIEMGALWEYAGYPEINGTMWFDREFSLSARQLASIAQRGSARLALGAIDDIDSTYVNGDFVGTVRKYNEDRYYEVPAAALQAGTNQLSVWVEDTGGGGGFSARPDSLYLDTGIGRIRLGGTGWRVRPEAIAYDSLGTPHQQPRYLYNGMLQPLAGVKAKGVLWYQGESNATDEARVNQYGGQIKRLVTQFRELADQPELPFVAVELPEWLPAVQENYQEASHWAQMRQAIRSVLELPATGTIVALGYGDTEDIHPRNKRPVSTLLAEEMMRLAYAETDGPRNAWPADIIEQGPAAVVVRFEHAGPGGLRTTDDEAPRGFAVQDAEGRWHSAEARLIGEDLIRVRSGAATAITGVAYAWSNNPDEANLLNGYGRRVGSWRRAVTE